MGTVIRKMSISSQYSLIQSWVLSLLDLYLDYAAIGRMFMGLTMYFNDNMPTRAPDILILKQENIHRLTDTHINAPADLIIEIISFGSTSTDMGEKFVEYEAAGVPEYWIIDPSRKSADIYALNDEGYYQRVKNTDDKIISQQLPDFVFDTALLWQEEFPKGRKIVQLVENMVKN
jgi:Uma2 family endonuclease